MGLEKATTTIGKTIIAWVRTDGKSILATRPVKVNIDRLKLAEKLKGDVVQISTPINKTFSSLEKRIISANNEDELIILGQEIHKFAGVDNLKRLLTSKYVLKYKAFYKNHYIGQNISPQNLFLEMFGKNLTKEEAEFLCSKYKAILQEPNLEKYLEKLFIQVKKDFGIDYLPIELRKDAIKGVGVATSGGMSKYLDFLELTYYKDNPINRHKLFGLMMHEANHAKQDEVAIATDFVEYVRALAQRLQKNPFNRDKSIEDLMQIVAKKIGPDKRNAIRSKYGKIDKNSKLYKLGASYIDGIKNYQGVKEYTEEAFINYKKQLIEKESYNIQSKANELYYYLTELYH